MTRKNYLFTSESVSEGHPDKVCDRISDEIVDEFFREGAKANIDPYAIRVAAETLCTTNRVVIAGEVRGPHMAFEHIEDVARKAIKSIGYEQDGFHWKHAKVEVLLHEQSADIAQGVDAAGNKDEGAGDQGIMFGYAVRETPDLLPGAALLFAQNFGKTRPRAPQRQGEGSRPRCQEPGHVALCRRKAGRGDADRAVASACRRKHSPQDVRRIVEPYIREALPAAWITAETVWHVNPTGKFFIGGPDGDAGLTGRKIIVDTYGGAAPHGGGAFSGKDPTKVDRSAAYAARYLAKNIVAAGLADRATIQLAYAIGVAEPLSIYVDLHGTGQVAEDKLEAVLPQIMRLSPRGIREHLQLNKPIYARTSAYGHFGRTPDADGGFSWENTDIADKLKAHFS